MAIVYEKIEVVSIDVDGTLTSGDYQIDRDGHVVKTFYTRDFCGIQMLLEAGIRVAIITQSHDIIIRRQIERICSHSKFWRKKYDNFHLIIFTGIDDKKKQMEKNLDALSLTFENLAHIGDAENDLDLLDKAYYTACPADAIEDIEDVDYRCERNGGRGAVHEFCKHLLEMKNANTKT